MFVDNVAYTDCGNYFHYARRQTAVEAFGAFGFQYEPELAGHFCRMAGKVAFNCSWKITWVYKYKKISKLLLYFKDLSI